ncbi:hypothetical protein LPJ53_001493 [Coemansia erecta]|uniref:Sfi1 spindle body domain-containing protein n=1 Tax=Coemansia erecta TaxID=147472 RepID=A0A9W7Y4U0_9FUNG|nr:hypothetical protein LPJ53_001493 [Coemansia erecta]
MAGFHDTPARATPRNRRRPKAASAAVATSYASTPAAAAAAAMIPMSRGTSRNTPRILGRYTTMQRIPHSLVSSQSDVEIEDDDAFNPPLVRQKHTIHTLGRSPRHPDVAYLEDDDDDREYNSAAIIRAFIENKHPGSQDIALLTMLRCWHAMTVDCRERFQRLRDRWVASTKVHRTNLIKEVFFKWKQEAIRNAAFPCSDYQRAQLRLATMNRRNLLLRMVATRLAQRVETMRQLEVFQQSNRFHLISSSLIVWKDQWQQRRQVTLMRLERQFKRESKKRLLVQSLRCWLVLARAEDFARYYEERNQNALVAGCIRTWQEQCVSRQYTNRSRRGTVDDARRFKKLIPRGESEVSADPQVHNIFVRWRAAAKEFKFAQVRAELFMLENSWRVTLVKLQDAYEFRCDMEYEADSHYKATLVGISLSRWCTQLHERRDRLLQSRAVQDIARRRDQKRRRVLLLAWREAVDKIRRAELGADDATPARQRIGFSDFTKSPEAGGSYGSTVRHISDHARGSHSSPLHHLNRGSPTGHLEYAHGEIQADRADDGRCDRAISVQSDSSRLASSDEKLELIRRAREAEAIVDQYKREWTDPQRVKLDLIDLDVDLERRLVLWTEYQNKHIYWHVLDRLQRAIAGTQVDRHRGGLRRHKGGSDNSLILEDEDERAGERLFAKNHPDKIIEAKFRPRHRTMRGVLDELQTTARARANAVAIADKHYYNRESPANQRLCKQVIAIWRSSFRNRLHMIKAAEDHYLGNVIRGFYFAATELQFTNLQHKDAAVSFDRQHTLLSVVRALFRHNLESMPGHNGRIDEHSYGGGGGGGGESDLDQGLIVDVTADGQDNVTDVSKLVHLREMLCAWRKTASDFQEAKISTIARLLPSMRPEMVEDDQDLGSFGWELMHKTFLIGQSFNYWRQLANGRAHTRHSQTASTIAYKPEIKEAQLDTESGVATANLLANIDVTADDLDGDGPRASELRLLEAKMATRVESQLCRTVLHRLMVLTRGKLLEQKRLARSVNKLMEAISERAKAAKIARGKARDFAARSSIRAWQNIYIKNSRNLDNAQTQANGTLVLTCFQHWRNVLEKRTSRKGQREMYAMAIALRWKHQAQGSLHRWMRASSNEHIMVRVAEGSGDQREAKLIEAADQWYSRRLAKNALKELDSLAFQRKAARRLDICFAAAWSNTNIQRKALLKWRTQASPSSSLFFSGSYSD